MVKQHVIKNTLLVLAIFAHYSIKADTQRWMRDSFDDEVLKRVADSARETFNNQLCPNKQTPAVTTWLNDKIKLGIIDIVNNIGSRSYSLNDSEMIKEAKVQAEDRMISFVLEISENEAMRYLRSLGHDNNDNLRDKITAKMAQDLRQELIKKRKTGGLCYFLRNSMIKTVDNLVDTEVRKLPAYQQSHVNNSVEERDFPDEAIMDILPKTIPDPSAFLDAKNVRKNRKPNCVICRKSFREAGNRINFPCGHACMCAGCFVYRFYVDGFHNCSECSQIIEASDFSLAYLKNKINEGRDTYAKFMEYFGRVNSLKRDKIKPLFDRN